MLARALGSSSERGRGLLEARLGGRVRARQASNLAVGDITQQEGACTYPDLSFQWILKRGADRLSIQPGKLAAHERRISKKLFIQEVYLTITHFKNY